MINGKKKIMLVIPSLTSGGMERVMQRIANNFAARPDTEVHLVLMFKDKISYDLDERIILHLPNVKASNPAARFYKLLKSFRSKVKTINPEALISLGSMYNSYVMLALLGLKKKPKIFLGDRSNPYRNTYFTFKKGGIERHDGIHHFLLKQWLYRKAHGLLVQTRLSYDIEKKSLGHKNIIYFPNPINAFKPSEIKKENIVLNVGRFIPSKQQLSLAKMFHSINNPDWQLIFLGDGPELEKVKKYIAENNINNIVFTGNVSNVEPYYQKAKIFAFTSTTEGFPNALGEALTVPLAAVAYDCVAGPADLIIDGETGYLVPVNDELLFTKRLKELMENEQLREEFSFKALQHVKKYDEKIVLDNLYNSLFAS